MLQRIIIWLANWRERYVDKRTSTCHRCGKREYIGEKRATYTCHDCYGVIAHEAWLLDREWKEEERKRRKEQRKRELVEALKVAVREVQKEQLCPNKRAEKE